MIGSKVDFQMLNKKLASLRGFAVKSNFETILFP